jgi:Spy/CpxP family protein refolding chaperone
MRQNKGGAPMKTKLAVTIGVLGLAALLITGIALTKGHRTGLGYDGYGPYGMMGEAGYGMWPGMMYGGGLHMGGYMGVGRFANDPDFAKQAGLTETQIAKLKQIQVNSRKALIKTSSELQALRVDLEELLDRNSSDTKQLDAKVESIGKKENELNKLLLHQQLESRAVLTEEQLSKADKYFNGRHTGWRSTANDKTWAGCPWYEQNTNGRETGRGYGPGYGRGMGGGGMMNNWDDSDTN